MSTAGTPDPESISQVLDDYLAKLTADPDDLGQEEDRLRNAAQHGDFGMLPSRSEGEFRSGTMCTLLAPSHHWSL